MIQFTIPGTLPDLNEIIDVAKKKAGKYAAYRELKKNCDIIVKASCPNVNYMISYIDHIDILWISPNARKDKDNIRAGIKFIQDGMQGKILTRDGYNNIGSYSDDFKVDRSNPRIVVTLYFNPENTEKRNG